MFDRVVLSTDENPNYIEFWPLVCSAWKKFFPEISVSLAFVSDRTESDDLLLRMKKFGDGIEIFKTVDGIPTANHAKVARLILASEFENEVCLIHDIDTVPLQSEYTKSCLAVRNAGELLAVGAELYKDTSDSGKFPMSHVTGEGWIFRKLFNPQGLDREAVVSRFIDCRVCDDKESINNHPDNFSDESLIRAMLYKNKDIVVRHWKRRIFFLDRSEWGNFHEDIWENGEYAEANMPRPFSSNYEEIEFIVKYICGDVLREEILLRI